MTNARFEDLEKRVRTIKVKRYMKLLLVVVILFAIGYYFVITEKSKKHVEKIPLHVKKEKAVKKPKVHEYKPIKNQIKKEEKKIVKVVEEEVVKEISDYDTIKLTPTVVLPNKVEKIKDDFKKPQKNNKINLHVKEVKSEEALLERFRVAGDFESAMGLANLYFEKKNFDKSIHWSKIASKLNSGEESAWLVYAKSKRALGRTDDAIKSLQLYLEYFSSESIKKLLRLYKGEK